MECHSSGVATVATVEVWESVASIQTALIVFLDPSVIYNPPILFRTVAAVLL